MQNLIGTEYENMTEEEIFLLNEKLIKATIFKKFPSYRTYCKTHMIEFDDLVQQGSIGLLNAIRTYESGKKSSFRSYAIDNIAWYIQAITRKESLRTINTRSSETIGIMSVENKIGGQDEDGISILDTLQSNNDTSEEAEENILLEKIIKLLEQDEDIDSDMLYILVARAKGQSMQSIADHFGFHRNSISQKLKTKKAERIKERIKAYLQNGEIK